MDEAVDFRSAEAIADPYPLLRRLQRDDPVHWNDGLGAWCLTRYADVDRAFKDPRFSADRVRPVALSRSRADPETARRLGDCLGLWMVFNDPPAHSRLRGLVSQAFTRRAIEALRPRIAAIVDDLLTAMAGRGRIDLIADFAYPLPAMVIGDMLGVPRVDIGALKRWSDELATFVLAGRLSPDKYERAAASLAEMLDYFGRLVEARRRKPGAEIIDRLIAAQREDGRLSAPELLASCVLLLFAGHETTTHFIANGMRALALHPGERGALAGAAADDAAIRQGLNELLRWDGPSIAQLRIAGEAIELHGRRIGAGERVYLFIAGANRDPEVFADPERLDIRRANASRQLAFGSGIHTCLGAHLARLEGEIAFPTLLRRLGDFALTEAAEEWSDSLVIRGLHRLPMTVRPSA